MNRICDDLNPGLDVQDQENEPEPDPNANASAPPAEEKQLRETNMPPPFNLVPLAPPPPPPAPASPQKSFNEQH